MIKRMNKCRHITNVFDEMMSVIHTRVHRFNQNQPGIGISQVYSKCYGEPHALLFSNLISFKKKRKKFCGMLLSNKI